MHRLTPNAPAVYKWNPGLFIRKWSATKTERQTTAKLLIFRANFVTGKLELERREFQFAITLKPIAWDN
jgi:hypothetical protein